MTTTTNLPAQADTFYAALHLRLLRLEIVVRWHRPTYIPQHNIANVLRGAFNITFRRLVCPPDWMNQHCPPCPLYAQCPYGQLFEPTPPPDSDRLRKQADLPRPFVLKPPVASEIRSQHGEGRGSKIEDRETTADDAPRTTTGHGPRTTDTLRFGLVLFGRAIDHLPHFVVTLAELGRTGMGPQRTPFEIESINALAPAGGLASDSPLSTLDSQLLYDPTTHELRRPSRLITAADLLTESQPPSHDTRPHALRRHYLSSLDLLPAAPPSILHSAFRTPHSVTVRFLTPTLIRSGSGVAADGRRIPAREVRERPDFGTLARRLRDRLAALCAFFGEQPWTAADFTLLGRLADEVRLAHSHTNWQHRTRRSTRTGQSHELSGLTGHATYDFPTPEHLRALLPLLRFGELMGVGKHAAWGNGWIQVEDAR